VSDLLRPNQSIFIDKSLLKSSVILNEKLIKQYRAVDEIYYVPAFHKPLPTKSVGKIHHIFIKR